MTPESVLPSSVAIVASYLDETTASKPAITRRMLALTGSSTSPSAADVFALFEHLLSGSNIRAQKDARPIVFALAPSGELWRFDPRARGALFAPATRAEPGVLHLRCTAQLLVRLLTSPSFTLRDDDEVSYEGRLDDLLPVAAALRLVGRTLGIGGRS
jgi:hypothetical protein